MSKLPSHIAILLPGLHGGGAERIMLHLAEGLAERELSVDLLLARTEGPYMSLVSPRVKVISLGERGLLAGLPRLLRYLRYEQPEFIISALEPANVVALVAKRLARVNTRLVLTVHSTLSVHLPNVVRGKFRVIPFLVPRIYPWADWVVAVSHGVAKDLVQTMGIDCRLIRVINNPVVTPALFAQAEEPLDHPWFISGEPPVVLGVGRLTLAKDFPLLIRAFAIVRAQRSVRLMILGEGEDRSRLEALVRGLGLQKDVALPGFVENPYAYIARSAIFVLSSRWEGLPTVLIEALACSTPVASTNCPSGPAEILKNGLYGPLSPIGDPKALADSIVAVLDHPPNKATLLQRAMDFSLDRICEQYLELLN